jgi:hypothetical protein
MKTDSTHNNSFEAQWQTNRKLANEFQTPLCVIISAGELLEGYFERLSPDRRRLALEDILAAARQMNCTVDSLLEQDKRAPNTNSLSPERKPKPRHSPKNLLTMHA